MHSDQDIQVNQDEGGEANPVQDIQENLDQNFEINRGETYQSQLDDILKDTKRKRKAKDFNGRENSCCIVM